VGRAACANVFLTATPVPPSLSAYKYFPSRSGRNSIIHPTPWIITDTLTIDGSNAGVILDGSGCLPEPAW